MVAMIKYFLQAFYSLLVFLIPLLKREKTQLFLHAHYPYAPPQSFETLMHKSEKLTSSAFLDFEYRNVR